MKHTTIKLFVLFFMFFSFFYQMNAQNGGVGINEDGSAPDSSAILDLNSTNKGFLPPRMTEAQKNSISNPAQALIIYQTDNSPGFYFFDGTTWQAMMAPPPSPYPAGTVYCNGSPTDIVDVTSLTGKIWMDRNLGASQVATSSTDANSYGDLYQWGRAADGHQCRTSDTTYTLSSIDQPTHGDFILAPSSPYCWRSPQNDNLWQGTGGTNNPCPVGYRLPTDTELDAERASWGSNNNAAGAFASPLKLPVAGYRNASNGSLLDVGTYGLYWSSTVSSTSSRYLFFHSTYAGLFTYFRASGYAVRCLKD